ncbi:MAG: hypothetical protein ACI3VP_01985 [Oscillospiraceae bacterium]
MLKTLIRIQLRAQLAGMMNRQRNGAKAAQKKKSATPVLFALLMLYCVVVFGFLFYMQFSQLAAAFAPAGLGWLYFAMYAIMAFALMFIGSIFLAKSQLFEAKDNELLLAMPIRPGDILLSRMVILLAYDFVFELVVAVPAALAWSMEVGFTALGAVSFALLIVTLPLFSMAVSCLFAWLLSLLTARIRHKSLFSMVFSLAFFAAYMVFCMRINQYVMQLAANGAVIAGKLAAVAPLYWMGSAMAGGSALHLVYALLVTAVPFVLAYWLLSRAFIRIVTAKRGFARIRYERKAMKRASQNAALLQREFRRLGACPAYMMNCGLGLVFMLAAAVFLVIKQADARMLVRALGFPAQTLGVIGVLAAGMLVSMAPFTAPSVALEGNTLWIIRTMPVSSEQVLRAKLRMGLMLMLPVMVLLLAALALVVQDGLVWACMSLTCVLLAVFMNNLGLVENLRHPGLGWINETQAVKQSVSVLFTMLLGWAVLLAMGLLWFLLLDGHIPAQAYLLIWSAVLALLNVLSGKWIMTRGARRFDAL